MGPLVGLGFYQVGSSGTPDFDVTIITGEGLQAAASTDPVVATVAQNPVVTVAGPGAITVTIPED